VESLCRNEAHCSHIQGSVKQPFIEQPKSGRLIGRYLSGSGLNAELAVVLNHVLGLWFLWCDAE
jgi:hypothetical protein